MKVHGTTACHPGKRFIDACERLATTVEPLYGAVSMDHVQLCPQNFGVLDHVLVDDLRSQFPATQFRLHANTRVSPFSRPGCGDASDYESNVRHFDNIVAVSRDLDAPAYSLHAGERENATLEQMRANVLDLQERMDVPVAVEGLYPQGGKWLVDSWAEYEWLYWSGLYYALDLSHLNIVARKEGLRTDLVASMLRDSRCLEVHISDNDGTRDAHAVCTKPAWWAPLLEGRRVHLDTIIFTEGNHGKP